MVAVGVVLSGPGIGDGSGISFSVGAWRLEGRGSSGGRGGAGGGGGW